MGALQLLSLLVLKKWVKNVLIYVKAAGDWFSVMFCVMRYIIFPKPLIIIFLKVIPKPCELTEMRPKFICGHTILLGHHLLNVGKKINEAIFSLSGVPCN